MKIKSKILGIISLYLLLTIVLCSCSSSIKSTVKDLDKTEKSNTLKYSTSNNAKSEKISIDREKFESFLNYVNNQEVEYSYPEIFSYEKTIQGLYDNCDIVNKHKVSALDSNNKLTKEHLFDIVKVNNDEYKKEHTTGLITQPEDDYILRVCEIIVDVANSWLAKYSDIDKDRVYCNLGNLKIFIKKGSTNIAAVDKDYVMLVSSGVSKTVNIISENGLYNTIVHETMHLIQRGCICEDIPNITRRCGLGHYYDNYDVQFADWSWFFEGSAERNMCLYTNDEPITYKNMIKYITSMDLATMFKEDVPINYAESISFYNDPDMLFDLFDCKNDKDKEEICNFMWALEIIQQEPADYVRLYKDTYGDEPDTDDVSYSLKPSIIKTLTKHFYRNLATYISKNQMEETDVLFMVKLFDATVATHLRLKADDSKQYVGEFVNWYKEVKNEFFNLFDNDMADKYNQYEVYMDCNENILNADLSNIDSDKKDFLMEKSESVEIYLDYKI